MSTKDFHAASATPDACRRELGERVCEELQRLGWRQGDLALAAGVAKGEASRISKGRRIPGQPKLQAVAAALGLAEDDLLPGIADWRAGTADARPQEVITTSYSRPGRVWIELRCELPTATALEIQRLAHEGDEAE